MTIDILLDFWWIKMKSFSRSRMFSYLFLALAMLFDFLLSKRSSSEEVVSLLWMACFFLLLKWQNKHKTQVFFCSRMVWFFYKTKTEMGSTVLFKFKIHANFSFIKYQNNLDREQHLLLSWGYPIPTWTLLKQLIPIR